MELSSIFDQFPVTLGDSEIADELTIEGESQVYRATDQTAAGEEEERAAAEQAAAAEGRRDESRTQILAMLRGLQSDFDSVNNK